jgi:hypothetical protein
MLSLIEIVLPSTEELVPMGIAPPLLICESRTSLIENS